MFNDHVISYYAMLWTNAEKLGCADLIWRWQGCFMDECERAEA